MKIPYFCCIGAELKRYAKDFDFMNQVYLYKVPTDDSIDEVLSEDYFKPISDSVLQDDIVYIYEASSETLHSCRFDKQNGHITAVPLASDETLAKTDLSNLTSAGANISNWSSNVTNCITEIPQDIKLELNNGTLTLKAGSKVYVPNGSGTFDTVTTTADVSTTRTDTNKCMVWRYSAGNLGIFPIQLFYSGPTAPTASTFMFWYDTTENKCKHTSDGGSTWVSGDSFPLCIVSTDGFTKYQRACTKWA